MVSVTSVIITAAYYLWTMQRIFLGKYNDAWESVLSPLTGRERFRWLVSPRSTVIQCSPVHTGRTSDPAGTIEHLMKSLVL